MRRTTKYVATALAIAVGAQFGETSQAAPIRYQFDSSPPPGMVRLHCALLADTNDVKPGDRTVIQLARIVEFRDHYYGKVKLDAKLFKQFIKNFEADVYGQEIYIDVSHSPGQGAAATIKKLFLDGTKFRAEVEWNEYGIDAVKKRGFRYLSIDFATEFTDPEDKEETPLGAVLFGAALTTRPRVKHQEKVQLSNDPVADPDHVHCGSTPQFKNLLLSEKKIMNKHLKRLLARLKAMNLSEGVQTQLVDAFKTATTDINDDGTIKTLSEQFEKTGEQLAEQIGDKTIQLDINVPDTADNARLTQADVLKLMEDQKKAQDTATATTAATLAERQGQYDGLMDTASDAEKGSLRTLSEKDMVTLRGARDLITADMNEDQVARLAENQITIGGQMVVALKLAETGYQVPGVTGNVQVSVDESNGIMRLNETVTAALRNTSEHANGNLMLSDKLGVFVTQTLALYDQQNMRSLLSEEITLAGGQTGIGDTNLPAAFQRTVIVEALHDLNVLQLVQTLIDASAAATTQIPYELRDTSAIENDGVVYEGQGIHSASISQEMDTAYITAMKLAMIVSNEVIHFTRSSAMNWEAWGRNVSSNARVMRELICRRICNEMQRNSDSYGAVAVVAPEAATVSSGAFKTANFPVVRAHQQKSMKGENIGNESNPIVVTDNGSDLEAFNGSGKQAPGIYYRVLSYNLGRFLICDKDGVATAPAGAVTVTYWYASNIFLFDSDPGALTLAEHLNGLLSGIGAQKAMMSGTRYVSPDFLLMSPTLNDAVTNAEQFVSSQKRDGTDTNMEGDLEKVKGLPSFGTNAPGIDLGDERILMGQRNTLSYVIAKAFATGEPFQEVNSEGMPTGRKQAYGEEYNSVHVPSPIRNRMTSVLFYSATNR